MLGINDLFDENYYLGQNPDVAQALQAGAFGSGQQHFINFGIRERRDPSAFFDTDFYLANYLDVEAEVKTGNITALEHFINFGQFEKRDPFLEFDTQHYLALENNPDVAEAVDRDEITGIQHFIKFGQLENRSFSEEFNPKSYLAVNPDVATFMDSSIDAFSAIQHFLQFGRNERRFLESVAPGENLRLATNFGVLDAASTISSNAIPGPGHQDLYSFTLPSSGKLNIDFRGLGDNDTVNIGKDIGRNFVVDQNTDELRDEIRPFESETGTINQISTNTLAAGTYFFRINRGSENNPTDANYSLILSFTPSDPIVDPNFDPNFGNGLLDAKQSVERAIGTPLANARLLTQADGDNFENLNKINLSSAWANGFTGEGIIIAVIDDGVDYNHIDLKRNIWTNPAEIAGNSIDDDGNGFVDDVRGWDFADNNNDPMPNSPQSIHGTHVAGTIAAARNGIGTTGVAYNAQIMPLKVDSNEEQQSNSSDIMPKVDIPAFAQAIRYAADNGAHIINASLSLNDPREGSEVADAIRYATSKDVVVVVAAGNQELTPTRFPASLADEIPGVVAVGAVNNQGLQARTTNLPTNENGEINPNLNFVVAPGVGVLSTSAGRQYEALSGTSMATPHVAGVAALVRQANPNLTNSQVVDILTGSTTVAGLIPFDAGPNETITIA